ncbi:MAG: hypothetical protein ABW292_09050, partial [Vicinamibacterales bacterium]
SGVARSIDDTAPLQAQAEQMPLRFTLGRDKVALDLRLVLGRRWLKLIAPIGPYADRFTEKYWFDMPDPTDRDQAAVCADAEVWQSFAAVAERALDGGMLFEYLTGGTGRHAYDGVAVAVGHKQAIDDAAELFVTWVGRMFTQSGRGQDTAWRADRLEYRFACAAPSEGGERIFTADEYQAGQLDWHSFDEGSAPDAPASLPGQDPRGTLTRTLIPVPLKYSGMPHPRWWTMEDGRTNFGDIRPDTTDLAKLLLIEFGLIFSNDWFSVPLTLESGSIASLKGLAVTSVFGERFWIEPAGSKASESWQRWSLFGLDVPDGMTAAQPTVLLLPTSPKVQEGAPFEEVLLIRDEMANMVWGVERTIPAPDGRGRSGALAGRETRAFHERLIVLGNQAPIPTLLPNDAKIRYELMTTVPEHWIPFIPVHIEGGQRAIQLQRAAIPRIIPGDPLTPAAKIRPRTSLLRFGLDQGVAYFLPEEEVPRSGARVTQTFRRARWHDGGVHVWLAARKQSGRGEGSSGLAYDRIVEKTGNEPSPD